jgi:predicted naringenin-chalcone synthase
MPLSILGMGTAVPPHRVSQDEAIQAAKKLAHCDPEQGAALTALYKQTDISARHMIIGRDVLQDVLDGTTKTGSRFVPRGPQDAGPDTAERMRIYEREALPLAEQACARALDDAELSPSAVTHLVTVSCTGFAAPGFDIGLMKKHNIRPSVARTHIGFMGCHGACNGLRVAHAFGQADRRARILLCATELSSLHYYYTWNPKRMVGNALFGDGAAALVARADTEPGGGHWRLRASGSCLFPDSEQALTWSIGNHGFDMTLSARVPNLIAAHLRPWLREWLTSLDLTIGQIGSWAIHPGGPRILTTIEESLCLPRGAVDASRHVLHEFGNMSSPTVLFILDRLCRQSAPLPCIALAFGPGMVVEGMLFD